MNSPVSSSHLAPSYCTRPLFTVSLPGRREWLRMCTTSYARQFILSVLNTAVANGHLTITEGPEVYQFGEESKDRMSVHLNVVNDSFWSHVLVSGELGFGEAYMLGDVEINDLKAVMELFLDNETGLSNFLVRISSAVSGILNAWIGQTRSQARLNAIEGYDQSNELFKVFLSKEMSYSTAIWGPEEGGVRGDLDFGSGSGDLEAAQKRKLQMIMNKARIKPGDRVLEFGSGWGGLAIEIAKTYGCQVDTLTLSTQQKALADERIEALGLQDLIRVHYRDYRDLPPEWEKAFDVFISIEMIEHVGSRYYNTFFKLVDWALKADNATAVVSASTFPEHRYSPYQAKDFVRKYMWPNGILPSVVTLINAANTASQGRFLLTGVDSQGAHYCRTLREWARRLEANLSQAVMVKEYPSLSDRAQFDAFKRKWRYFFAYAEAGFARGYITTHMITLVRSNDPPDA